MISNINACINHGGALEKVVKGLQTGAVTNAATCTQNFTTLQTQISGQAQDMAVLKGTNEKLLAENAKLLAQVAEFGNVLKWVVNQVGQNSQLVAQSQSQGQQVQGRVQGMESGMAQVLAQVGGLSERCSSIRRPQHPCHPL